MKFYKIKLICKVFVAVILVIVLGIHIGDGLFGNRSYIVLKNLQSQKAFLYKDIIRLEEENAKLQKIYLERASLSPDYKEIL
ncbi:hypothetical protein [Campylobacter ureolyticus]|uniref:Septum formation initiator n=1 Tax=Campylobacter ureolyticus TaxID=827 RepID=A0A9Q4KMM3_9BACT|nr:hypothetical protein [Campylobacter ureolyticus]MCZ6159574.1 hypothetical protein [Campylobacter ureolyticus]MCZ6160872.1 hypothetical protein [Campylobacter ureolyticus]MCZ6163521.1 hypothetical protein [Campylobacter ureolyticus]MCZ6165397.1 hypothetical protein [Campylobacter ureolyticus]MCZ6166870.1 hypothetical protein [Campylobacter ureolyticus]